MTTEIEYHKNGQLKYEWPTINGKYHGILKGWWNNGNIKYICSRLNGQLQGMRQDWNYDGTRDFMLQWKNDNRHGPDITFKY